jgi:thiamine kinase-like enzyme
MILNDPALPHCATALDTQVMVGQFAQHMNAVSPGIEWQVKRCGIEKVYYRPAHHCGILYRLTLCHPSGQEADEWFFGRLCPPGRGYDQLERTAAAVRHFYVAHDFLRRIPPISFWPDLNMMVWIFPQDPCMVTLPYLMDPDFVRHQIKLNWPAFGALAKGANGHSHTWHCTEVACDRVKYMPGKRCVLRFQLEMSGTSGDSRQVRFYSKTYNDGWSHYHFNMLKSACEQLAAQASKLNVPRPLAYLDGFNTLWQEEWSGKPLIDVLESQNWPELFPRIAEVLAALHRSGIKGFRPGPDLDEVMNTAIEDGSKLLFLMPACQPFITPMLERLQAEKSAIALLQIPAAPIHGACRLEQLVVREAELALVDFDAVAIGDPLFDVAEFIASLQFLEFTQGKPRDHLAKAAEWFYQSYAENVEWPCDRRRLAWYILVFLTSKMYGALKHYDVPAMQRLESAGSELINGWLESLNS